MICEIIIPLVGKSVGIFLKFSLLYPKQKSDNFGVVMKVFCLFRFVE